MVGDDGVEDALQVGVGAGDDPAEHIADAGDGVHLQDLGDRSETFGNGVVAADLADLEGEASPQVR